VALGWRRAEVVVALGGDLGADLLRQHPGHFDDPVALMDQCLDRSAGLHGRRRLACSGVDLHVAVATCRSSVRARLREPHGVPPLVDADGVDDAILPLRSPAGIVPTLAARSPITPSSRASAPCRF
jgi:hypothetical protein